MAERDEWLQRIGKIRRHSSDGVRAPHKPLLILTALARLQQKGSSTLRFADDEQTLAGLLTDFGSPTTKPTPEYPFNRLQNDGLWVVDAGGEDVGETKSKLRATTRPDRSRPNSRPHCMLTRHSVR